MWAVDFSDEQKLSTDALLLTVLPENRVKVCRRSSNSDNFNFFSNNQDEYECSVVHTMTHQFWSISTDPRQTVESEEHYQELLSPTIPKIQPPSRDISGVPKARC